MRLGDPMPRDRPALDATTIVVVEDIAPRHLVATVAAEVGLRADVEHVHWIGVRRHGSDGDLAGRTERDQALELAEVLGTAAGVTWEELEHGKALDRIAEADAAALVVCPHHDEPTLYEKLAGSLARSVAERVRAPYLVVPHFWDPAEPSRGGLVVGVDDLRSLPVLVESAAFEATRRRLGLRIAHSGDDREVVAAAGAAAAHARAAHPGLVVETVPLPPDADQSLGDVSVHADLLVIGHTLPHHRHARPHAGHVALGVIGATTCPVLFVPTGHG